MADITFECPECKQHFVIDAGNAGLDIQCPTCSRSIKVPGQPSIQREALTSSFPNTNKVVRGILIGWGIIMVTIFCWLVISWMYGKANYIHQANDSAMKEATRRAWSDIQSAEAQLSRDYSSNDQIYSQRAFLYSQINTDDADPELVKYVAQVVEVSKGTASVLNKIASDIQKSHQDGETVEQVMTVVGAVLGASANNGRSLEENAADGQTVGAIAGTIVNGVGTSIEDDNIKQQYSNDLASCSSNLKNVDGNRAWLADYLSKKYQSQFLTGF
jgi:hypothetical protein